MKLFVGLGNPGQDYVFNRHNVGFMAVDAIAAAHGFPNWRKRFNGLATEGRLGADQVLLFPFAAGVATWWRTVGPKVAGLPNLSVVQIPHAPVQQLAQTVDRRVSAQVMVMEGQVTMTVGGVDVTFTPEPLK